MNQKRSRSDFPSKIRSIIAQRAGYRCSLPSCGRPTIGPGYEPDDVANCGTAAHIFGASPDGPRGSGGLSQDELRSLSNAIWLCAYCSRLIDSNDGKSYAPNVLQGYKDLHEARIRNELEGRASNFGWLQELTIRSSPIFSPFTTLGLGRLTLITGGNVIGKSSICEWIAGFAGPEKLGRWKDLSPGDQPIDLMLKCFHPEKIEIGLRVEGVNNITYTVNSSTTPFIPFLRVVKLKDGSVHRDTLASDIDLIAALLDEKASTISHLVPRLEELGTGWVTKARITNENGRDIFRAATKRSPYDFAFSQYSYAEELRVLIEFAIALSRLSSRHNPTLLILDQCMTSFDEKFLRELIGDLVKYYGAFQVLAVLPLGRFDPALMQWSGWTIAHLVDGPRGVDISQSIRSESSSNL